jgi:hypothetical protein
MCDGVPGRSTGVSPGVSPVTHVLWASRPQLRRKMRLETLTHRQDVDATVLHI